MRFCEAAFKPARNCVKPPPMITLAASRPGWALRDGSAAAGLIAERLTKTSADTRLNPPRMVLTRLGLKIWVSSTEYSCSSVKLLFNTSFMVSGAVKGVLSNIKLPDRLSFSENLWSTREVTKFSLTAWFPAKVKNPVSPFPPGASPPSGRGYKGRYFWADASTATVFGEQAVGVLGTEQRFPARAAAEGTMSRTETPFD